MPNKVLISGIAGFLGSHVAQLFTEKGWQVIGVDNFTKHELARTGYNVQEARDYNKRFLRDIGAEVLIGDIRDKEKMFWFAKGCDYIINCAAQPAMTIAIEDPVLDVQTNILGSINILEAGRKRDIPVALCSTIHVYGNGINKDLTYDGPRCQMKCMTEIPETYEALTGSITPLHTSKYSSELYARAFNETYGSDVLVARLTGMYGEAQFGGEDHSWLANFAIRTICGKPIRIFGTDKQVRDMLYVKDAARAFFDWYYGGKRSGIYNICGGTKNIISLGESLQMLAKITGKKQQIEYAAPRQGDLHYFVGNYSKSYNAFNWEPKVRLRDGIERLVIWVEANKSIFMS